MHRALQCVLVIVCLAVAGTISVFWLRSLAFRDEFTVARAEKAVFASDSGHLEFAVASCASGTIVPDGPFSVTLERGPATVYEPRLTWTWRQPLPFERDQLTEGRLGVHRFTHFIYSPRPLVQDVCVVAVPHSLLFVASSLYPSWMFVKFLRWRRKRRSSGGVRSQPNSAASDPESGVAKGFQVIWPEQRAATESEREKLSETFRSLATALQRARSENWRRGSGQF